MTQDREQRLCQDAQQVTLSRNIVANLEFAIAQSVYNLRAEQERVLLAVSLQTLREALECT
jgi:hypothetical protein